MAEAGASIRSRLHPIRGLSSLLLGLLIVLLPASAGAAELLMFEKPGCPWCERWDSEVAPGYARSAEGRRAPLRRLDMRARPAGIALAAPVTHSPTFVLVDGGREIGRITGYPGADFFWGLLAELLAKLDRGAAVSREGATGHCAHELHRHIRQALAGDGFLGSATVS